MSTDLNDAEGMLLTDEELDSVSGAKLSEDEYRVFKYRMNSDKGKIISRGRCPLCNRGLKIIRKEGPIIYEGVCRNCRKRWIILR